MRLRVVTARWRGVVSLPSQPKQPPRVAYTLVLMYPPERACNGRVHTSESTVGARDLSLR